MRIFEEILEANLLPDAIALIKKVRCLCAYYLVFCSTKRAFSLCTLSF